METRFSMAIHILIMLSESSTTLSSQAIANSVGTNSSFVRRLIAQMKESNLVKRDENKYGYKLAKQANLITLLEVFKALNNDNPHTFEIHQNANDKCIVGKYIKPTLNNLFINIDKQLSEILEKQTLESCIEQMKLVIDQGENNESYKNR